MELSLSQETQLDVLRRRCAELEKELEHLRLKQQTRLTIAADVHPSLLPGPVRHDRIWIDVRYVPIEEVGGDYCQVRFPDRATCYVTMCDVMRWRSDKVPGFCSDKLPCPFTVRVERRPWERYAGGFQMLEERRRTCTPVPYLRRRCRPTWSGVFMRMNSLHSSCAPESLKLVRAPTNAGPAQPTTGALRKRGPLRQPTQ